MEAMPIFLQLLLQGISSATGLIMIPSIISPQVWTTIYLHLRPLTIQGGHGLIAVFDPLPFNIAINSSTGGNATIVQAPGPFYFDNNYTLSASPEYGYSFDSWTSSSNSLGLLSSTTSIQPTFTLNGDVSFTGNFSENQYLLTVLTGSGGASVSPSTPTLYNHSSQVSITATPLKDTNLTNGKM